MKFLRSSLIAAALFVCAGSASAQVVAGSRSGIQRQNLISANPIGLLFEWYNGEIEHAVSNTASVAFAASRFSFDDPEHYTVADAIVRYYPAARALRGFSVGMSAGIADYRDNSTCYYNVPDGSAIATACGNNSGTAATIGVRGDYVWVIGRDQHFSVATGIGAKRVIGNDIGTEGLPIGRLSIGYAW